MAWTNWGFDGTINEAQWAQMAGLLGNDYVAAGNSDCLVTAVPGARSVSVAAGTLYGDGVVSVNSGPETVAMTTPVNGQWYVIALRRTWATNTAALVAIAGATTSTTTPTAPPTSLPTLNTNKGVLTDQPIAWAWCNSANTTVVIFDMRLTPYKPITPQSVSSVNDRNAKFYAPTNGMRAWRTDTLTEEIYNGSAWKPGVAIGEWQSYTPTVSNFSVGNGVTDARYTQIGNTVFVKYRFTIGSTTSFSGTPVVSLPISMKRGSYYAGTACLVNGSGVWPFISEVNNGSNVALYATLTNGTYALFSGWVGSIATGAGVVLEFQMSYEVA